MTEGMVELLTRTQRERDAANAAVAELVGALKDLTKACEKYGPDNPFHDVRFPQIEAALEVLAKHAPETEGSGDGR